MKSPRTEDPEARAALPITIATPAADGANFDGHADGRVSPADSRVTVTFYPNGQGTTPAIPGNVTVTGLRWEATFDMNGVAATTVGYLEATNDDVGGAAATRSDLVWVPTNVLAGNSQNAKAAKGKSGKAAAARRGPRIKITSPTFAELGTYPETAQVFQITGKVTGLIPTGVRVRLQVVRVDEETGYQYPILGVVSPPFGLRNWVATAISEETGANAFAILAHLTDRTGRFLNLDTSGNITIKRFRFT